MSELGQLQSSIARIFREALPSTTNWKNQEAVKELQKINQELARVSPPPPSASIAQVVATFRQSRKVASYRDLKYVCYGAALPMLDGWCVLGDDKLRDKLLADVEQSDETWKRFKYFQALLSSYFSFARYEEQTSKAAHAGWKVLRDWLAQQKTQFQRDGANKKIGLPGWFIVLDKHENLLTNKLCDCYGEDMLRGDNAGIEEARQGLGIPVDSWVMQEAILSQMKSAADDGGDDSFKAHLDRLLKLVRGQTEVKVSDLLKRRAVAILVSRYARCKSKPEHPALRDAAVSIIGNPWLKRTAWDASVIKSDGQPDDEAREMVNGWLTKRLIKDFFELLSANDNLVQRRRDYWLKYESQIDGLWFVLGPDAWGKAKYDSAYKAVKGRCDESQWLEMTRATNRDNNAFVMRMGDKLVVEFGLTGNACFFYLADPMPFALSRTIAEPSLKIHNKSGIGKKLTHQGSWESSFDWIMAGDVSDWPRQSTSQLKVPSIFPESNESKVVTSYQTAARRNNFDEPAFWILIKKHSILTEDDRSSGNALWVKIEQSRYPMIDQLLGAWGFKYKLGRGWWKE